LNPFATLLLLFLVVPLVEIYLLIQAGGVIGALPTVGLVVLTAVVGAWLLRLQGLATLRRAKASLADGVLPETALVEGVLLLLAGALLLTPGFVTDALGFLLLVPPLRVAVSEYVLVRVRVRARHGDVHHAARSRESGRVIEGEAHHEEDAPRD
jgi:UPF0716 protein FxsA